MTLFSSYDRNAIFEKIKNDELDILIIGGGITGAGIALDAVQRGVRTALVEMQDFAAGTSSRSTKLIHGGLRYLAQFEVKLVAEVGKERAIVYENGPHVTTPEWMMLPFYKGGTFGAFQTSVGLRIYDFLAKVKKAERRKMLSPAEAMKKEPLLQQENLKGAGYYVEYKTDDARLTLEVLKKAVEFGAKAINYARVTTFLYDENDKVNGVIVKDEISGVIYYIYAQKVVNATGPWVDVMREKDESIREDNLLLTKGVHLVFSQEHFPLQQAIYFDAKDKRMIFAIPRGNKTYVGTTDTKYAGEIANPTIREIDRNYLLEMINYMFPTLQLTEKHIDSSWAGLRSLIAEKGKSLDEISRKDEIICSQSGLYSIAGGKLTGYRKMAQEVVDTVFPRLKQEEDTTNLPISGGNVGGSKGFLIYKEKMLHIGMRLGLGRAATEQLIQTYGSNVQVIFNLYENNKQLAEVEKIDPIVFATLLYAIEYELAYKPIDFFIRRTSALFFDIDLVEREKVNVTCFMAKTLKWSNEQTKQYMDELDQMLIEAKYHTTSK